MGKIASLEKIFLQEKYWNKVLAKDGPHQFILILDHLKKDFNIGKIFRSAEAFGVREIHLLGTKIFDPAASKGCFRKVKARFFHDFSESYAALKEEGYQIVVLDSKTDRYLHNFQLPEKTAFVLGNEELGPVFDASAYNDLVTLKIQQFGKVESLNVSVSAAVAMYQYLQQHCYHA